ncbi:hypothetical protein RFI_17109 [Reticulomyxa filosa]|uniref:Uncharacterized protein n=1 Tax=Reticulomyxa filosa TaxID=46433 RepID=X6N466_RETFI|nr:hypothetical protein RFI_17109 [Reticulomyxa filosa]|eukprot:ETO20107.1 hypothetical protein RFI_17109 [Reticulomyxa filosa]
MCLVGGFSQSRYLQHRLKQHYESKYTFVIPQRPILSVIEGAAQLARIPSFIASRIVKCTYGTSCGKSIGYARDRPDKFSDDHINKYKYISDINNKEYVSNCFRTFVNKDEEVKVGQMVQHSYNKSQKNQKKAHAAIFCSEERDPGITNGCRCLGSIEVPFPEDFDDIKDSLFVRFYFGETIIRVTIIIKGKEYLEKEIQIKYEYGSGQSNMVE